MTSRRGSVVRFYPPGRWSLKSPSESADTFVEVRVSRKPIYGLLLVAALFASVWLAAPAQSASVSGPSALKLLINGKKLPITPFSGPDRYNPIKVSKLRVEARWLGSLTGTGYRVVITTTEPTTRTWRTCTTGTSCLVSQQVPILKGEEMSWTVRIMKVKPHFVKILGGFMVCLVRNATPS